MSSKFAIGNRVLLIANRNTTSNSGKIVAVHYNWFQVAFDDNNCDWCFCNDLKLDKSHPPTDNKELT